MKKCFYLLWMLMIVSCSDQQTNGLIIEPAGSAHYYINNLTESDLLVEYIATRELNFETGSVEVPADSSALIFTDGIIGRNPKPSDSFSLIRFFRTDNTASPVLLIEPIVDEDWVVTGSEIENTGYGLTEYEFTITGQDLAQ
jgi:hypothetical protein